MMILHTAQPFNQRGRNCGVVLGKAGMSDPIDDAAVLIARTGAI